METIKTSTTPKRTRKIKESPPVTTERESLEVHVDICQMRYQQLEDRIARVENQVATVSKDLQDVKAEMRAGFDQLKSMIAVNQTQRFNTMVATAGTVIVALVGMLGYVITHIQ